MSRKWKFLLPILFVSVGLGVAALLVHAKPTVEKVAPAPLVPLVRVVPASPVSVSMDVTSQGTVLPRTEAALIAEVSGRIEAVSPSFETGGFFERGEVLLRLDGRDYRLAITRAEAEVARARTRLLREQAEAEVAVEEWQQLERAGDPGPLVTRQAQVAEAEAAVAGAEANLEQAKLNLDRTLVRAPYTGRVRAKQADVGQFANPGQVLGRIYAVDYVEVRLPVPDEDLAFLELPIAYRGEAGAGGPRVTLSAEFAGQRHSWQGRVVRTEGEIDARSRMVNLVARVEDPYGRSVEGRPPLAVGLFVEAEVDGRDLPDLIALPRAALRGEGQVLVLEDGDRLRFRQVEVLRRAGDLVYVASGLAPGDHVCVSPLETVVDGMQVRVAEGAVPGEAADAAGASS